MRSRTTKCLSCLRPIIEVQGGSLDGAPLFCSSECQTNFESDRPDLIPLLHLGLERVSDHGKLAICLIGKDGVFRTRIKRGENDAIGYSGEIDK